MAKSDLRVDWCSHDAAKYACEHWHYSRCMPVGKLVKIGVWESGKFIGAAIFGRGASPSLGKQIDLSQDQCVELVRICLSKHECPVSRIIAIALNFLSSANPGLRCIVSFADPDKGHHGGVYQASNWLYTGDSPPTTELFVNGRWVHWRGGFYEKTNSTPKRVMPGKHRYLMPLDAEMRARVLPLSKPYPKRPKKPDDPDQGNRGRGSTDPDAPCFAGKPT